MIKHIINYKISKVTFIRDILESWIHNLYFIKPILQQSLCIKTELATKHPH